MLIVKVGSFSLVISLVCSLDHIDTSVGEASATTNWVDGDESHSEACRHQCANG